ncbi:MAG: NAD(P)-binding protein [Ectothiorhodospiraceae bacterium]|nr:NAD(P)-binding protein [Ectothiorhodospiraceae bacterium]
MSTVADKTLEADYLIIGSGAMGMAFADVILAETDASVVMVDRHDNPGGHWNDAYPFVRLHSPSAFYGVSSAPLGHNALDQSGLNKGLHELASAAELCSYYDRLMHQTFLPGGRMRYFPKCDYRGEDRFASLISGAEHRVAVRRKLVDATHTDTQVPSTHPPSFGISAGVDCVPPNALPKLARAHSHYVVLGGGKTGIDACLWLLEHAVAAEAITWIMPRDPWLVDRTHLQPGDGFFEQRVGSMALQMELISQAGSVPHLFRLLEASGQLLRLDPAVEPTMYRCATVTRAELDRLREIEHVVRLGRVRRIQPGRAVLDRGIIDVPHGTLFINCAANGIRQHAALPIFGGDRITLQAVRSCQPCLSAAFIAHLEASIDDEAEKNRLCTPIPYPSEPVDWLRMQLANLSNHYQWTRQPELRQWLANSRLDYNHGRLSAADPTQAAIMERFRRSVGPAVARLREMLAEAAGEHAAAEGAAAS